MWGLGNTWSTCFVMFMLWSGEKCVPCWWFLSTFSLWLQYAQQHPLHHERGGEWEQNQWNCLSYLDQGENYYVCNWIWVQPSVVNWWFPSCTLARHRRRAAKFLHLEQLVQDIVCEKTFFHSMSLFLWNILTISSSITMEWWFKGLSWDAHKCPVKASMRNNSKQWDELQWWTLQAQVKHWVPNRLVNAGENPSQITGNTGQEILSTQACVDRLGMNSSHILHSLIL